MAFHSHILVSLTFILITAITLDVSDPPPPIWKNAFTVSGAISWGKIYSNGSIYISAESTFVEYYDYSNTRMRIDYAKGQADEMCVSYPSEACQLYFDESGALFSYYPSKDYCCMACPAGQYCTVIKPVGAICFCFILYKTWI